MKRIHVVAGIIYDPARNKLLIARRPDHLHQGGLWEFPGGKVNAGEQPEQALKRELKEELAINATDCRQVLSIHHDYLDKHIFLDVWQIDSFSGQPKGNEGQEVRWVTTQTLAQYNFPKANTEIINWLTNRNN